MRCPECDYDILDEKLDRNYDTIYAEVQGEVQLGIRHR